MIFQLKSGKIVQLTVDQYLNLTDKELDDLETSGAGDYPPSPFYGSVIKKKGKPDKEKTSEEDKNVDFNREDEEGTGKAPEVRIPDEELPTLPSDDDILFED